MKGNYDFASESGQRDEELFVFSVEYHLVEKQQAGVTTQFVGCFFGTPQSSGSKSGGE